MEVSTLQSCGNPELKAILAEAIHALARLDADHLEEAARYCEVLMDGTGMTGADPGLRGDDADTPDREMMTFARVLEATRINLRVMRRLRGMNVAQLEYSLEPARCHPGGEGEHGEH